MTRASHDDHPIIESSHHAPTRTHVKSLRLSFFRNYLNTPVKAEGHSIVLVGPNGSGKTNILEAISLLTPGRGLRRASLGDLDNNSGSGSWSVTAEVCGMQGAVFIGTGRDSESPETEKRIVKIDGKTSRGQVGLAKVFSALWLTPQMDNLFIEGGSARRKFLDRLVYSFDAEHASRVNAYEFAMRERNRLLGMSQSDDRWVAALEQKMAEQGVAIAVARAHALEGLGQAMLLSRHSFPRSILSLTGVVEDALKEGYARIVEDQFRELLAASRLRDAASGRAQAGVHRAQVNVVHAEKNMPAERCSTGEQKALLISIILAQARAGAAWHGSIPVLLLDEVATHLDPLRRAELYAELAAIGAQAWITGTDREIFMGFDGQFIAVKAGEIIPDV